MISPDDERFAETAVAAKMLTPEQVAKVMTRLKVMSGVNFAELAILSRALSVDDVLEVGRLLKLGAAPAAGHAAPPAPPAPQPQHPQQQPHHQHHVVTQAIAGLRETRRGTPAPPPQKQPDAAANTHTRAPIKSTIKLEEETEPPSVYPGLPPPRKRESKSTTRKIDLTEGGFEGFDIRPFLRAARNFGASDVHLTVGRPPFARLHGILRELDGPTLDPDETEATAFDLAGPENEARMRVEKQGEFLLKDEEGRRYRCCTIKQRLGWDLAIRVIRETIPTADELGIPKQLLRLTEYQQGLVLIAGPGGSGKSSTLAALLQVINHSREGHIITIEDPVEYLLEPDKCHITQRQLNRHTETYAKALRAALRESPDVIAIGELRDRETASIAISAAETGHLVFATLHTGTAMRTVSSLVDLFPPGQRQQLLTMLSESIRGVICQQLVPGANKQSRHLALEVLLFTPGVASIVREDKTAMLVTQMQTGRKLGMCRFDDSLDELVRARKITVEEAHARAESKDRFRLAGTATGTGTR